MVTTQKHHENNQGKKLCNPYLDYCASSLHYCFHFFGLHELVHVKNEMFWALCNHLWVIFIDKYVCNVVKWQNRLYVSALKNMWQKRFICWFRSCWLRSSRLKPKSHLPHDVGVRVPRDVNFVICPRSPCTNFGWHAGFTHYKHAKCTCAGEARLAHFWCLKCNCVQSAAVHICTEVWTNLKSLQLR